MTGAIVDDGLEADPFEWIQAADLCYPERPPLAAFVWEGGQWGGWIEPGNPSGFIRAEELVEVPR